MLESNQRLLLYNADWYPLSISRTYCHVLPSLLRLALLTKIQHTACCSPCELLNHTSRLCDVLSGTNPHTPLSLLLPPTLRREASDCFCDYPLPIGINWVCVSSWACDPLCYGVTLTLSFRTVPQRPPLLPFWTAPRGDGWTCLDELLTKRCFVGYTALGGSHLLSWRR